MAEVLCGRPAFYRPGSADEPDQKFIRSHETDRRPGRDHRADRTVCRVLPTATARASTAVASTNITACAGIGPDAGRMCQHASEFGWCEDEERRCSYAAWGCALFRAAAAIPVGDCLIITGGRTGRPRAEVRGNGLHLGAWFLPCLLSTCVSA